MGLSNEGALIFDPFAGASSTGVGALLHNRNYWGCDFKAEYIQISKKRLEETLNGSVKYRPYDKPIMDPSTSAMSKYPEEWKQKKE